MLNISKIETIDNLYNIDNIYSLYNLYKLNLLLCNSLSHYFYLDSNKNIIENKNLKDILKEKLLDKNIQIIQEKLIEHSYRSKFSAKYYLDNIIDNNNLNQLIKEIFNKKININLIKDLIQNIVFFHDLGKISYYFQNKQMNINIEKLNSIENKFKIKFIKEEEDKLNIKPPHSKYITKIDTYLSNLKEDINTRTQKIFYYFNKENIYLEKSKDEINILNFLCDLMFKLSEKHHTNIEDIFILNDYNFNFDNIKQKEKLLILTEILYDVILFSDNFSTGYFYNEIKNNLNFEITSCKENDKEFQKYLNYLKNEDKNNLYQYIKKELQKSTIDENLSDYMKKSILNNEKIKFNKEIIENNEEINIFEKINDIENKLDKKNQNILLNELKTITAKKFYKNLKFENKYYQLIEKEKKDNEYFNLNNFHFFKGTTGIGKTNISFLFIHKLLQIHKLNNVKMVFPLLTLIEQYGKDFETTFNINEFDKKDYENGLISYINSINLEKINNDEKINYLKFKYEIQGYKFPFIFTSHVNFFDKLFNKNRTSYSFLHTLKNSCIILDEIQLYNDINFEVCFNYLMYLSKLYNFQVLIVSATIPYADKNQTYNDKNTNEKREKYILNEISLKRRFVINEEEINYINNSKLFKRSLIVNQELLNNNNKFEKYKKYFNKDTKLFDNKKEIKLIEEILKNYFNKKEKKIGLITFNTINQLKTVEKELIKIIKNNKLNIEIRNFNNGLTQISIESILKEIKSINNNKHMLILASQKIDTGIDISVNFSVRYKSYLDNLFQNKGRLNRYMTFNTEESLFFIIEDDNKFQPLYINKNSFKEFDFNKFYSNKKVVDLNYLDPFLNNNVEEYYKRIFNRNNDKKKQKFASEKIIDFNIYNIKKISEMKMINNDYIPNKILLNFKLQTIKEVFCNTKSKYFNQKFKNIIDNIDFNLNDLITILDIYNDFHVLNSEISKNIKYKRKKEFKYILTLLTINTTIPKSIKDYIDIFEEKKFEFKNEYFLKKYTHKVEEEQIKLLIDNKNITSSKNPIYDFENGFVMKNSIEDESII